MLYNLLRMDIDSFKGELNRFIGKQIKIDLFAQLWQQIWDHLDFTLLDQLTEHIEMEAKLSLEPWKPSDST